MGNVSSLAALVCAVGAGFLGGAISRNILPVASVQAQMIVPPPQHPDNRPGPHGVVAQRFVLVDAAGTVYGEFKLNGDKPEIDLYDKNGRVLWKTNVNQGIRPVGIPE